MIVINFKNYCTNLKLIERAKLIEKYLPKAIICVPPSDIFEATAETRLKVFSEHVDWHEKGRNTGFIIPEEIKEDGAVGTLLNHSEHPLTPEIVSKTIRRTNKVNLKVILCVSSLNEASKYKKLKPWAMAFEDPKLVSSGKSITTYESEDIKKFAKILKKTKIISLCGAGISKAEDVVAAKKLGCRGVLISSAIVASPKNKAEILLKKISKI